MKLVTKTEIALRRKRKELAMIGRKIDKIERGLAKYSHGVYHDLICQYYSILVEIDSIENSVL